MKDQIRMDVNDIATRQIPVQPIHALMASVDLQLRVRLVTDKREDTLPDILGHDLNTWYEARVGEHAKEAPCMWIPPNTEITREASVAHCVPLQKHAGQWDQQIRPEGKEQYRARLDGIGLTAAQIDDIWENGPEA